MLGLGRCIPFVDSKSVDMVALLCGIYGHTKTNRRSEKQSVAITMAKHDEKCVPQCIKIDSGLGKGKSYSQESLAPPSKVNVRGRGSQSILLYDDMPGTNEAQVPNDLLRIGQRISAL